MHTFSKFSVHLAGCCHLVDVYRRSGNAALAKEGGNW